MRRAIVARSTSTLCTLVVCIRNAYVENIENVDKFRNKEASDVRRKHAGVPLGSTPVLRKALQEEQWAAVHSDNFTDWNTFYKTAAFFSLLLFALEYSVRNPAPLDITEYTPYVKEEHSGK